MNKADVASLRKEFKVDNTKLKLKDIVSFYVKGESKEIVGVEKEYFDMMDATKQELFVKNFKKLLTGSLDSRVFELDFSNNKLGQNPAQQVMYHTLHTGAFEEAVKEIAKTIIDNCSYESDFMISFVRGHIYKATRKEKGEDDAGMDDEVFAYEFFMCSVNPVSMPKTALKFDFDDKEFRADIPMDVVINVTAPLDGFMFPSWNDNYSDVNKIVYYSKKENNPNMEFVTNVLQCDFRATARMEKTQFLEIIQEVVGKEVEPEKIGNIYEQVNYIANVNEGSEIPGVGIKDMERILKSSGVEDTQRLEFAFKKITGKDNYEFKSSSIVPNFTSKSIKIGNETASVAVSPRDLKHVKQVRKNGRRYLLIEIDESAELEGFELSTENF